MIDFYTASTPNGQEISIPHEEWGIPYAIHPVDKSKEEHRSLEYFCICPAGSIPAIINRGSGEFVVLEPAAMPLCLAEKYNQLLPHAREGRFIIVQWLMQQTGCISPIRLQISAFFRSRRTRSSQAVRSLREELRRLYAALEYILVARSLLCDDYSIADIAVFTWINAHAWSGIGIDYLPSLKARLERMRTRPAVVRGLAIPPQETCISTNATFDHRDNRSRDEPMAHLPA